jgi:hypothetical protein
MTELATVTSIDGRPLPAPVEYALVPADEYADLVELQLLALELRRKRDEHRRRKYAHIKTGALDDVADSPAVERLVHRIEETRNRG